MNGWELATAALMVGGIRPALVLTARGTAVARLVGLQLAGSVTVLVLLLAAQASGQSSCLIVALVLALLDVAGTLVFVRLIRSRGRHRLRGRGCCARGPRSCGCTCSPR